MLNNVLESPRCFILKHRMKAASLTVVEVPDEFSRQAASKTRVLSSISSAYSKEAKRSRTSLPWRLRPDSLVFNTTETLSANTNNAPQG